MRDASHQAPTATAQAAAVLPERGFAAPGMEAAVTAPQIDRHAQILALEPALLAFAARLTDDPQEAEALVRLTFEEALAEPDEGPDGGDVSQSRLYSIMRRAFHSIARRSTARRARGSPGNGVFNPARAATFARPEEPVS
jgi:DNA-directed RNA polymerase specialized sigma24 family protein